jgi:hypothetical protein
MEKMMRISSIQEMEKIVESNPNMSWDSWSVLILTDDDGYYTKNGIFKDGKWKTQYVYNMSEYGVWNIPDRFLTHVQV